jgi:hypothetical protein
MLFGAKKSTAEKYDDTIRVKQKQSEHYPKPKIPSSSMPRLSIIELPVLENV